MMGQHTGDELEQAMKQQYQALERDNLDIATHINCERIAMCLDDAEKYRYHSFMASGLTESILDSGDGRSIETAYTVISTREEHAILKKLHLDNPVEQALIEDGDHFYDLICVTDVTGKDTLKLYFNIDIPYKSLTNALK